MNKEWYDFGFIVFIISFSCGIGISLLYLKNIIGLESISTSLETAAVICFVIAFYGIVSAVCLIPEKKQKENNS